MSEQLTRLWIGAQIWMWNFWDDFKKEEKGAAEIVAILLVIVVIIAIVIIFRKRISDLIDNVFKKADDFVNN